MILLNSFGLDEIPETTIAILRKNLSDYPALAGCTELIFNQSRSKGIDNFRYMRELRTRDSLDILSQTEKIAYLERKVQQLSKYEKNTFAFDALSKELKINYDAIAEISFANVIHSNFSKTDTLPVFQVKWVDSISNENSRAKDKTKLEKWLKYKLKLDTLVVKRIN
jgi:hypothetical protein